jgi:hypothetical protein
MSKISMSAAALAPTTFPAGTALVGHWRKNEQTGRLECHWSLVRNSSGARPPRVAA